MKKLERHGSAETAVKTVREKIQTAKSCSSAAAGLVNLKSILAATDFSDLSASAYRYALALADLFDAKVHLVHVIDKPAFGDGGSIALAIANKASLQSQDQKLTQFAKAENPHIQVAVFPQLVRGKPWLEIVRCARQTSADLLILGTRGYGGLRHAVLGSTAERVVREAPCPVLVVRPRDEGTPEMIVSSN